jgi:ataxia telangiectasia mutated family protein
LIFIYIGCLLSSKIKDRNEALERLQNINFSLASAIDNFDRETLLKLIDSLDLYLKSDRTIYEKSNNNAVVEIRLNKTSSILRSIIVHILGQEKFISLYKPRQSERIIDILLKNLTYIPVDSDIQIFEPVVLNLTKALNHLIRIQCFRDHLFSTTNELIVSKVIKCLNLIVSESKQTSNNENLLIDLLSLFYEMLNPSYTSTLNIFLNKNDTSNENYYSQIFKIAFMYFKNVFADNKRERESLIFIFKIINKSLLDLSTTDVKLCHRFYKLGVQFILEVKAITSKRLVSEVAIFINLIPPFIALNKLQKIVGDNWNIGLHGELINSASTPTLISKNPEKSENSDVFSAIINASSEAEESLFFSETEDLASNIFSSENAGKRKHQLVSDTNQQLNDLAKALEIVFNLFHDNALAKHLGLFSNSVNLHIFPMLNDSKYNWFHLKYISLQKGEHSTPWLLRLGFSRLLISYYELKLESALELATSNLKTKRQRLAVIKLGLSFQLSDYLKYFDDPIDFMISLLMDEPYTNMSCSTTIAQILALFLGYLSSNNEFTNIQKLLNIISQQTLDILNKLMEIFEKQNDKLKYWVLFVINIFYSIIVNYQSSEATKNNIFELTNGSTFTKLLKYCLELLKDLSMSKLSCVFLSHFSMFHFTGKETKQILDKSIVQQYENIIDLSEINGPACICKESVLFWVTTVNVCKKIKFRNIKFHNSLNIYDYQLYSQRILNWFQSKFDKIVDLDDFNDILPTLEFINWLLGYGALKMSSEFFNHTENIYDGNCLDFIINNLEQFRLCEYILKNEASDTDNFIDTKNFTIQAEPLLVNEISKNRITSLLSDFTDRCSSSNLKPGAVIWAITINCIFSEETDIEFESIISKNANFIREKFRDFHKHEESTLVLQSYLDLIQKIPLQEKLFLNRIANLISLSEVTDIALHLLDSSNNKNAYLDVETDVFDSFMPSTLKEVKNDSFFNYRSYNYNNLYNKCLTIEQQVVHTILKLNSVKSNYNTCFEAALKFASRIKRQNQCMAIQYELLKFIEQNNLTLNENILDMLFNNLTTLLESHLTKTYECAIVIITKLFNRFCNIWIESTCGIEGDGKAVYEFLSNLHKKTMLHSERSLVEFFNFSIKIIEVRSMMTVEFQEDFILNIATDCFEHLDSFGKIKVSHSLKSCIKIKQNRFELYTAFIKSFKNPQRTVESAATFCYFMTCLSGAAETLIIVIICNLLELSTYPQMKTYLSHAVNQITRINRIKDAHHLFWNFKEVFLKCWESFEISIEKFPFELFGFDSMDDFYLRTYKEISALSLSYNHIEILKDIAKVVDMKESSLVHDSMSLSITLSWSKGGIKNKVFKTFEKYFLSSKTLKSNLREQFLLIIFQLFRFCDCSSEAEILNSIEHLVDTENLLLSKDAVILDFLEEYELFVKPKSCLEMIEYFGDICGIDDIWSVPVVYHLTSKLLLLIEASVLQVEKQVHFRKLKLLFMVAGVGFQNQQICEILTTNISPYLGDDLFMHDAAGILTAMVQANKNNLSNFSINIWVTLVSCLFEGPKCANIKKLGNIIFSLKDKIHAGCYDPLLKYGLATAESFSFDKIPSLIEFINMACHDSNHTNKLVKFLSMLFKHNGNFQLGRFEIEEEKLSQQFIQNIFDIKNKYLSELSEPMLVWIGKCIGVYYQNTGNYPLSESYEFDSRILIENTKFDFNKEVKSLDLIFNLMIQELPSSSLRTKYCFEAIVGVILHKHNTLLENVESFISYDLLFKFFEDFIYPTSDYVCSLLIDQVETATLPYYKNGLENALNGFSTIIKAYKYDKWLRQLLFSVINELSTHTSIIILLANYICHIPSFAFKCFCPLVLYFIESQPIKRGRIIAKMIQDFFKEDIEKLPKEAVAVFVELSLLIRVGAKHGNQKFITILNYFDIPEIAKAALFLGKNKAALMLLEDYYTTMDLVENKDILSDPHFNTILKQIYSGIEDKDLMFGLPIVPELSYGIQILQNNNLGWGEMMFNNAIFESGLTWDDPEKINSVKKITHGMMDLGWSGVSNIMNDYLAQINTSIDRDTNTDIVYEQLWKLNQWDVSVSTQCQSENQYIYSILKQIKEIPYAHKRICHDTTTKVLSSDISAFQTSGMTKTESLESWVRTLSICNLIDEISSLDDTNFKSHFESFSKTSKWFRDATASEFENILLSRRAMFEIMSHYDIADDGGCFSLGNRNCWLAIVNELNFYTNLMTDKGLTQKAINSSVDLNQIAIKKFANQNLLVNRISKYNLAKAFWTQQSDTRFPVQTLKDIIRTDEINDYYVNSEDVSHVTEISTGFLVATLAKWCDECKQEKSSTIMNKYIEPVTGSLEKDIENAAKDIGLTYHIVAKFCDDQIAKKESNTSTEKLSHSIKSIENDMKSLTKYLKEDLPKEKKRYALQDFNRLKIRHQLQKKELEAAELEKDNYVRKAINYYFKSIAFDGHEFVESDIDRFFSLWIEHNDINLNDNDLLSLPTFHIVPWNSQLVSRLLDENTTFQNLLRKLVINMSLSHPFHILYLIKSLRMTLEESDDAAAVSRGKVAAKIWQTLNNSSIVFNVEGISDILESVDFFADNAVEIANVHLKNTKKVSLSKLPHGSWWLTTLPRLSFPSPVKNISVSTHGPYKVENLLTISKVSDLLTVAASGVSHPKIMKVILSNGESQKMLLKAPDDLRQDAIMKQVFEKVNNLLWKDIETRKRNLRIRTYNVLPLGPTSGVLEFVPNSVPLIDVLKSLHSGDEMDINEARLKMKEIQAQSKSIRYQIYQDICKKITPSLRAFFFNNFTSSDLWFESRSLYCHGIATTSIIGYILGIGDRHCNNILLDKSSGEPIHIDFGVAFDQGKALPVPETVPFRLTRDLVDGMGITDINGMFSKSSEHVLRVLRNNTQYICGILDVLKYDPLYSWTLSPLRKKKLQQIYFNNEETDIGLEEFVKTDLGSEANAAIDTVKKKLEANGLSDEAVVRELIREAVDPKNLALIFMGWSPFL